MELSGLWVFAVVLAVAIVVVVAMRRVSKAVTAKMGRIVAEQREKTEAMFRASFPELQPHFHPARVFEYVKARRARKGSGAFKWTSPPGFPAAAAAEIEPEADSERVRLLDTAGAPLAQFVYQDVPEGGTLRLGNGKLTATLNGPEPRVRYWHPDREFKWTPRGWKFQTRVADREMDSSDSGTSWSDSDSSSDASSSMRTAALAGGVAGVAGAAAARGARTRDSSTTSY